MQGIEEQQAVRELVKGLRRGEELAVARDKAREAFKAAQAKRKRLVARADQEVKKAEDAWLLLRQQATVAGRAETELRGIFLRDPAVARLVQELKASRSEVVQAERKVERQQIAVRESRDYVARVSRMGLLKHELEDKQKHLAAMEEDLAVLERSLRVSTEELDRLQEEHDRRWKELLAL